MKNQLRSWWEYFSDNISNFPEIVSEFIVHFALFTESKTFLWIKKIPSYRKKSYFLSITFKLYENLWFLNSFYFYMFTIFWRTQIYSELLKWIIESLYREAEVFNFFEKLNFPCQLLLISTKFTDFLWRLRGQPTFKFSKIRFFFSFSLSLKPWNSCRNLLFHQKIAYVGRKSFRSALNALLARRARRVSQNTIFSTCRHDSGKTTGRICLNFF